MERQEKEEPKCGGRVGKDHELTREANRSEMLERSACLGLI